MGLFGFIGRGIGGGGGEELGGLCFESQLGFEVESLGSGQQLPVANTLIGFVNWFICFLIFISPLFNPIICGYIFVSNIYLFCLLKITMHS